MSETQSVKRSGYQRSAQMQSSQQHRDHALCLVLAVVDRHLGEYVEVKKRQRMLASLITTHNLQGMAKEASTLVLRTLTPEQFFNWIVRLAKFTAQGAGGTKAFFEKGSKAIQSAELARLGYQPEAKQSSDEQSVPGSSSLQYRASSVLEDSGHGHVKATPAKSKQQDSGPAIVAPLAIAESDSTYSMQMEKTRQLIPRIIATPSLANATTREHVSESSSPFNPAKINSSSSERQNSVDEQVPAEGPLHDFAKTISSDYSGSERSEQPIDGVASESPAKTEGSGSVFGGTEAKQVFESTSPRSAAEAASPMNKRKHNASDNDREKEKSQSLLLPTTLDAGRPGPASEGPGPSSKTLRRDYNLTRLGDNEVKRYLDDIWTFMQSSTQHFINKLRIDAEGPARFDPNPPGDLQALYVKLFGVEWQTRKRVLGYAKALLAPDLIAALLAAAVHDAGFCRPITWQIPEEKLAEMQAAGELGAATRVAQSAGMLTWCLSSF